MIFVIFILLVSLSAFFSASETAFLSLRESQVRLMERRKEWNAALIAYLKARPQETLVIILIGNNLVNISIASLATLVGVEYFKSLGAGIATGASTVVIILLGEILPKTFAILHKRSVAQWAAFPLIILVTIARPVTTLFTKIERFMQKYFRTNTAHIISEEEIRTMIELGLEHGQIDHHERQMIERVFEFDDTTVGEIATPSRAIESLNGEAPIDEIAHFVALSGYSRFPVYIGKKSSYIGYVHTNDVMRALNSDDRVKPLANIVLPLRSVDESFDIRRVFKMMTKESSHLYLVHRHDNPGRIVGLVTMEDILEQIVGDIEDESDRRDSNLT